MYVIIILPRPEKFGSIAVEARGIYFNVCSNLGEGLKLCEQLPTQKLYLGS